MSSWEHLPRVVIACRVLEPMLDPLLARGLAREVIYMEYGLHRTPAKMTRALQDALERIEQASLVLLGYGLCGNGLHGLQAGRHMLLAPRVDDCIALLLGSYQAYRRQFEAAPGTCYLSRGWLEAGSHPLREYQECAARYGRSEADWILDQQYRSYTRLVLVAHSQEELEACRPRALEVARFCERWGMRYEEIVGSDRYARRLVEVAESPETADADVLLVRPGGRICQDQYRR